MRKLLRQQTLATINTACHHMRDEMHAKLIEAEETRTWTTPGGKVVKLRPIHAMDADKVIAFIDNLSYGTRYFRFGNGGFKFSKEEGDSLCNAVSAACPHLIVVTDENDVEIQIAAARYCILEDEESCEMAILVADSWHGTGVAHWLTTALIEMARDRGLKRMVARVLGTNFRMQKFVQKHGFTLLPGADQSAIQTLVIALDDPHG